MPKARNLSLWINPTYCYPASDIVRNAFLEVCVENIMNISNNKKTIELCIMRCCVKYSVFAHNALKIFGRISFTDKQVIMDASVPVYMSQHVMMIHK